MAAEAHSTEARAYSEKWSERDWERLSPHQQYVTEQVARGRSYADIAADLQSAVNTVTSHASHAADRIPGLPGLDPKEKLTNFYAARMSGWTLSTEAHKSVPNPKGAAL